MNARARRRMIAKNALMHGDLPPRTAMSESEVGQLFTQIDSKHFSPGLAKLSGWDLDELHLAPVRKLERGGPIASWNPGGRMTLLAYAAHRRNHSVVMRLLAAGADPSIRAAWTTEQLEDPTALDSDSRPVRAVQSEGASRFCAALEPAYAAWLVERVVAMRHHCSKGTDRLDSRWLGPHCCVFCQQNCGAQELRFLDCKHQLCEPCYWHGCTARSPLAADELECKLCATTPGLLLRPWAEDNHGDGAHLASAARARDSLARYHMLADTAAAAAATMPPRLKREKQVACTRRVAAALRPGHTQATRTYSFLAAVCAGDVLRVAALIELGVDIDVRDECGETALMLAAQGLSTPPGDLVPLLLWAGAGMDIESYTGCSARWLLERNQSGPFTTSGKVDDEQIQANSSDKFIEPQFLLDRDMIHPGAGSFFVDNAFEKRFIHNLHKLWARVPEDSSATMEHMQAQKRNFGDTCCMRRHFADAQGGVTKAVGAVVAAALGVRSTSVTVLPRMRFLYYMEAGGQMQPHVDLPKKLRDQSQSSTHTFMLHLVDCAEGGETIFLKQLTTKNKSKNGGDNVLAAVAPLSGRLIVFPHSCPHAGLPVVSAPKLFLRGELLFDSSISEPFSIKQTALPEDDVTTQSAAKLTQKTIATTTFTQQQSLQLFRCARPAFEDLLWKLVDHGICPRCCLQSDWCSDATGLRCFASLPMQLDPGALRSSAPLPPERAHRKRCQVSAIVQLVDALLQQASVPDRQHSLANSSSRSDELTRKLGHRPLLVDFCGGAGHLGLVLAARFTEVDVLVVDYNGYKLGLGEARAAELGIGNYRTLTADIANFVAPRPQGRFAIGIALHACGSATDLALAACTRVGASFIASPCCVGKVAEFRGFIGERTRICDGRHNGLQMPRSLLFNEVLNAEEYLTLAAAADFHSKECPDPFRQAAKLYVEVDRLAAVLEHNCASRQLVNPQDDAHTTVSTEQYRVRLGQLPAEARSPKNDVLWGWTRDSVGIVEDEELQQRWSRTEVAAPLVTCGLWPYETTDSSLPGACSVLVPQADRQALDHTMELIQRAAQARDSNCLEVRIAVDPPANAQRSFQRDRWKAMKAAKWAKKSWEQEKKLSADEFAAQMQMKSFGPISNAHGQRKIVQILARANCIGCTRQTPLELAPLPHWPFVWDHGIELAGRVLEEIVEPAAKTVPRARQLGLVARRKQLRHRLTLVSESELRHLQRVQSDEWSTGKRSGKDASQLLESAEQALCHALGGPDAPYATGSCRVDSQGLPSRDEAHVLCGAVKFACPTRLHYIVLQWPAASRWRCELGLAEFPNAEVDGFLVELGL